MISRSADILCCFENDAAVSAFFGVLRTYEYSPKKTENSERDLVELFKRAGVDNPRDLRHTFVFDDLRWQVSNVELMNSCIKFNWEDNEDCYSEELPQLLRKAGAGEIFYYQYGDWGDSFSVINGEDEVQEIYTTGSDPEVDMLFTREDGTFEGGNMEAYIQIYRQRRFEKN